MQATTQRQPSIFLPHGGGPCFFMDWSWGPADSWQPTQRFLEGLAATLPERPRALLVVTAHWEEAGFRVTANPTPGLIYDYYGFPEHTYQLQWPAPGDPALAAHVVDLLQKEKLPVVVDAERGFDHGVFVPMKVVFPEAKIPTVALSLAAGLDPAEHLAAGRALAPLRDEGVLIVASGMSFHNLRAYFAPGTTEKARAFDDWLTETVRQPGAARAEGLRRWREAPWAGFSHPREEHLIPLMVAAGAGGEAPGEKIFGDEPMAAALSAYRFE